MELGQAAAERGVVGGVDTHKLKVETLLLALDGCWRLPKRSCFRANWDTRTDRWDSQHLSGPMAVDIVLVSVAVPADAPLARASPPTSNAAPGAISVRESTSVATGKAYITGRCRVRMRSRRTADQEVRPMKAITAVLGGVLVLFAATSAMAQT